MHCFFEFFQHNNVPAVDSLCIDYLSKCVTYDGGTRCLRFPCTTADTLLAQLLQAYVLLIVCTRLNNANLHSGRVCHSIVRKSTADSMLISDSTRITFSFTSEFDLCAGVCGKGYCGLCPSWQYGVSTREAEGPRVFPRKLFVICISLSVSRAICGHPKSAQPAKEAYTGLYFVSEL